MAEDTGRALKALAIAEQVTRLLEQTPGAGPVLDALRSGEMDPDEAVLKLASLAIEAGHGDTLMVASAELSESYDVDTIDDPGEGDGDAAPVEWVHPNGTKMVNPLMSAAIKERASIDGDVPEARLGPIPEGGSPAVPVITDALDPVVVGYQLEQASKTVSGLLQLAVDQHKEMVNDVLDRVSQDSANLPAPMQEAALELAKSKMPPIPTGVGGYETGRRPKALAVPEPDAGTMALLLNEDRRRYTYKALATTQGRESVAPGLRKALVASLALAGISVAEGDPDENTPDAVRAEWTTVVYGPEDMADGFNPISTAVKALSTNLCFAFDEWPDRIWIRVTPYNGVADRRFGWSVLASPQPKTHKTK